MANHDSEGIQAKNTSRADQRDLKAGACKKKEGNITILADYSLPFAMKL
ncbi:MAG: hypothetical protein R6U62_04060 [Bacteroidales bacterium]